MKAAAATKIDDGAFGTLLERQYLVGRRAAHPCACNEGMLTAAAAACTAVPAVQQAVKVSPKGASSSLATLLTQGPRLYGIVLDGGKIYHSFYPSFIDL